MAGPSSIPSTALSPKHHQVEHWKCSLSTFMVAHVTPGTQSLSSSAFSGHSIELLTQPWQDFPWAHDQPLAPMGIAPTIVIFILET